MCASKTSSISCRSRHNRLSVIQGAWVVRLLVVSRSRQLPQVPVLNHDANTRSFQLCNAYLFYFIEEKMKVSQGDR
jgi:hypothetical protein